MEGSCSNLGKPKMQCLMSVYAHGNVALTTAEGSGDPLGGEFELSKSAAGR
jgi:hypothetical protein